MHENELSEQIIGAAIEVHQELGPGLLESVYEEALCHELSLRKIGFERQKNVQVQYKGVKLKSDLRLDLVIDNKVIVDIKAKDKMTEIDRAKTLTYCRLSNIKLGLNINFHATRLINGVVRIVNGLKEQ